MYRTEHLDEVSIYLDDREGFPTVETNIVVHGLCAELVWDRDHNGGGWVIDRLYDNQNNRIDDVAGYKGIVRSAQRYVDRLELREAA